MNEVEKEIYEYYSENVEEHREMLGNESQANKIDSISGLTNLVKPMEFIVRKERNNGKRRLGLLCEVSWDIENGLGVKIEDEIIEEVGYQDIVL